MLRYTGKGFMPGFPARDLQESEIDALCKAAGVTREQLVQSGCYVDERPSKRESFPARKSSARPSAKSKLDEEA